MQIQRQVSIVANILHNMVFKILFGQAVLHPPSTQVSSFFEILFLFLTEPDIYVKNLESSIFFKKTKTKTLVWLLFMLLFHTTS